MTLWDGSFAASILALSVTACAVPPLPKGEALARPYTLHFSRKLYRHAKGSPLGRAGALAPERASTRTGKSAVYLYDPFREKAILENPQIFQNCEIINILSAEDAQSNAERIQNRPLSLYNEN